MRYLTQSSQQEVATVVPVTLQGSKLKFRNLKSSCTGPYSEEPEFKLRAAWFWGCITQGHKETSRVGMKVSRVRIKGGKTLQDSWGQAGGY